MAIIHIDFTEDNWTRLPEVFEYAKRRSITTQEAIRDLVNQGLSHEPARLDSNQQPLNHRGQS